MYQMQLSPIADIGMGEAVFIIGLLALLLWTGVTFRNPAAIVAWTFSILIFIFSRLFDIGFELFWIATIVTIVLLVIGIVAQWTQQ